VLLTALYGWYFFDKAKAVIIHLITAFALFAYLVAPYKAGDEKTTNQFKTVNLS